MSATSSGLLDPYRSGESILHTTDARVKLILTLAFLVFLNLTPAGAWPAYVLFFSLAQAAIILSELGVRAVWGRSLLALPFVLAALPLIFTGPAPAWQVDLGRWVHVAVSQPGFERFVSIAFKSWVSVQAAVLLSATTPFVELAAALRWIGAPRLFVAVFSLMWRYLFLLVEEAQRMMRARESRSPRVTNRASRRRRNGVFWQARVTGGMAGSLFVRSLERSDRVYAAMLARGYNGEPPMKTVDRMSRRDWILVFAGGGVLACLLVLSLV